LEPVKAAASPVEIAFANEARSDFFLRFFFFALRFRAELEEELEDEELGGGGGGFGGFVGVCPEAPEDLLRMWLEDLLG